MIDWSQRIVNPDRPAWLDYLSLIAAGVVLGVMAAQWWLS